MKNKNFYITTTLPYVNSDPHIGFALEIVQADVIARYQKLLGKEVFFNTGTDEHGLKIYRKALEEGLEPQEFCDKYAAKFDQLKEKLNLSYNNFIRTTDKNHILAAQEFWKRCEKNGDIYKAKYKVKYCVGCELEKTDSELEEGKCPIHPDRELEVLEEENYFFKFSKYQKPLLEFYQKNPQFVVPEFRYHEIIKFVEGGLRDFSISRLKEKLPWGVPVPGDENQVMYVWFDALINYISCLGWPPPATPQESKFEAFWPGMQVAGKDNLRQQTAMWQAMLISAGLPNSTQVLIHGFINIGGQKISKSLGNVVDPFALVDKYGTDALRYYLLRGITPFEDGDFTIEKFEARYNGELANGLGNLISRVAKLGENLAEKLAPTLPTTLENIASASFKQKMEEFKFNEALDEIWDIITLTNQHIDQTKPWEKIGTVETQNLASLLAPAVANIRQITVLLEPFLPETAKKIATQFAGPTIKSAEPLFPRI